MVLIMFINNLVEHFPKSPAFLLPKVRVVNPARRSSDTLAADKII